MHFKNVENSCNQKKKKNTYVCPECIPKCISECIYKCFPKYISKCICTQQHKPSQPRATTRQTIGKNIHYWICWTIVIFCFERLASKLKTKGHHILLKAPKNCEIHTIG